MSRPMPIRWCLGGLVAAGLVLSASSPAAAAGSQSVQALERAGVREIIVRRDAGLGVRRRRAIRSSVDGRRVRRLRLARTEVLRVPAGTLAEAVAALQARDDVRFAEPDAPVRGYTDDRYWSLQWALENTGQDVGSGTGTPGADIGATRAWSLSTGTGVTVAIADTGIDVTHPELASQITGNPGERGEGREDNGVDDDGNGLVDDAAGWDFVTGTGEADETPGADRVPADADGHGTHVAGTIAAVRDNREGIAGAAPESRVLPLRVLGADGTGSMSAIADAFDYAGDLGVPVVNASLGSAYRSEAMEAVIAAHPATLFVTAAGNGGDDEAGDDVDDSDARPEFPCASPAPNVLCVSASDNRDRPARFANVGRTSVDLFAPGVDIASTFLLRSATCPAYCFLTGTSMAAPYAAASAALVAALRPDLRGDALREVLVATAAPREALAELSVSGGRLDAAAAVTAASIPPPLADPVPASPAEPAQEGSGPVEPAPEAPAPDAPGPPTPVSGSARP